MLVHAAQNTLLFPVDERLGGEVVDTVIKASLDHLGVHLDGDEVRSRRRQTRSSQSAELPGGRSIIGSYSTYSHKLLHLPPLHAGSKLALFRCIEAVAVSKTN